eukprot:TRINITY_DN9859_c0_g2_i1.p1 TRINITY_DN9859_c0_g2~~TRINITY_DN9859_c0_g2_i1.p1  ORF type:complete len:427 (-),score=53.43 TRINITY_DN9859_c0_g2_i1:615-1895(-)
MCIRDSMESIQEFTLNALRDGKAGDDAEAGADSEAAKSPGEGTFKPDSPPPDAAFSKADDEVPRPATPPAYANSTEISPTFTSWPNSPRTQDPFSKTDPGAPSALPEVFANSTEETTANPLSMTHSPNPGPHPPSMKGDNPGPHPPSVKGDTSPESGDSGAGFGKWKRAAAAVVHSGSPKKKTFRFSRTLFSQRAAEQRVQLSPTISTGGAATTAQHAFEIPQKTLATPTTPTHQAFELPQKTPDPLHAPFQRRPSPVQAREQVATTNTTAARSHTPPGHVPRPPAKRRNPSPKRRPSPIQTRDATNTALEPKTVNGVEGTFPQSSRRCEVEAAVSELFDRYTIMDDGYLDDPDSVNGVCFGAASSLGLVTISPVEIERKVRELRSDKTRDGDIEFKITLAELQAWFWEQVMPLDDSAEVSGEITV